MPGEGLEKQELARVADLTVASQQAPEVTLGRLCWLQPQTCCHLYVANSQQPYGPQALQQQQGFCGFLCACSATWFVC
jgi:hypothetical protein